MFLKAHTAAPGIIPGVNKNNSGNVSCWQAQPVHNNSSGNFVFWQSMYTAPPPANEKRLKNTHARERLSSHDCDYNVEQKPYQILCTPTTLVVNTKNRLMFSSGYQRGLYRRPDWYVPIGFGVDPAAEHAFSVLFFPAYPPRVSLSSLRDCSLISGTLTVYLVYVNAAV